MAKRLPSHVVRKALFARGCREDNKAGGARHRAEDNNWHSSSAKPCQALEFMFGLEER
jgi:hypothetical protein